jgi:hypothetical protein
MYEPVGLSDKPLPKIHIQESCKDDSVKCFNLDTESFESLRQYIKKYEGLSAIVNGSEYPYGAYKVTLMDKEIILSDKKNSYLFFKNQLIFLQKNEALYNEIKTLLKRLE